MAKPSPRRSASAASAASAAPRCPQTVEPGIDFMSHLLLQHLAQGEGNLAVGIKPAALSLIQPERPIMVMLTTDTTGTIKDCVLSNLCNLCGAMGVPVVYTLSRRHMGEACMAPCGVGAVAILRVPDEHRELLATIARRAARAWTDWAMATAAAGGTPEPAAGGIATASAAPAVPLYVAQCPV